MKLCFLRASLSFLSLGLCTGLLLLSSPQTSGQAVQVPASAPSRPGFSGFHSNLGLQEIVEVGVPLREVAPAPATPLVPAVSGQPSAGSQPAVPSVPTVPGQTPSGAGFLKASVSSGIRLYHTSNVLRTKSKENGSGVYEFNAGAGLGTRPLRLGEYVTLIPRIDYITQWAKYGEKSVQGLLEYQFSMVKGSMALGLPDDWSLGFGLEYDHLSSLSSGDRMFDAVAPALSIQKIVPFSEKSFLMIDSMIKYANTDRVLGYAIPGVFADDGDNLQTTLNFSYLRAFGSKERFLFMPNLGFTRTSYTKNEHQGRVDYLFTLGASGIYQWKEWLGIQTFLNYSKMFTNEKGEDLLLQSSKFRAWDFGVALTGNYQF